MSFSEPLVNQVKIFLLSVGMGVLLCGVYILVQSFFCLFGKSRAVQAFADLLFCIAFALLSFFFMIFYNNGRVRLHLVFGEALGFAAFYVSGGKFILKLFSGAVCLLNKLIAFLIFPVRRVAVAFINIFAEIKTSVKENKSSENLSKSVDKAGEGLLRKKLSLKRKKVDKIGKIHLQNSDKSV